MNVQRADETIAVRTAGSVHGEEVDVDILLTVTDVQDASTETDVVVEAKCDFSHVGDQLVGL
jgi:hypothetical protein